MAQPGKSRAEVSDDSKAEYDDKYKLGKSEIGGSEVDNGEVCCVENMCYHKDTLIILLHLY